MKAMPLSYLLEKANTIMQRTKWLEGMALGGFIELNRGVLHGLGEIMYAAEGIIGEIDKWTTEGDDDESVG